MWVAFSELIKQYCMLFSIVGIWENCFGEDKSEVAWSNWRQCHYQVGKSIISIFPLSLFFLSFLFAQGINLLLWEWAFKGMFLKTFIRLVCQQWKCLPPPPCWYLIILTCTWYFVWCLIYCFIYSICHQFTSWRRQEQYAERTMKYNNLL